MGDRVTFAPLRVSLAVNFVVLPGHNRGQIVVVEQLENVPGIVFVET